MVSEYEDQLPPSPPVGSRHATQMKSKISYTRDFLLCFSQLDICKKLPSGFDASILSEFEDASNSTHEWQRNLGGSSLQNPKRSDYGLLPPNRLEGSGNLSRGSAGRWDTRSSGSSDRDGDLQSDRESFTQDSGRRFGNQTRHFWQRPEHDGLLGSGAFSRPSAYAGTSAQKARGSGQYQLNRSTEPYQPPRPYKAVTYSRKETDLCNDETFGSAECSSEDRAEEERKRRASFELMRKEQQKALHEKKKQIPDNHKENNDADIIALLVNSEDEKSIRNRSNRPDDPVVPTLSQNDSSRPSFHIQAPASRRPVPPGFASALTEKNISMQSSNTSLASEDGIAFSNNNLTLTCMDNDQERRSHSVESKCRNMLNNDVESISVHTDANENIVIPSSGVQVSKHPVIFENLSSLPFGLPDANDVWEDVMSDLSNKQVARSDIMSADNNRSTSILEKLFGSALSKDHNGSSNLVEGQGVKEEEEKTRNSAVSESSKFAHWFPEEEKKTAEDLSSRDLLSLILSNEKAGSQSLSSSDKGIEHFPPILSSENKDRMAELLPSSTTSSIAGIPEQYYPGEKLTSSSGVLTCEDLEQSILAEVTESSPTLQQSLQGPWLDNKSKEQKADVDDCASQHLLSLLQKGPKESSPRIDVEGFSDDKLTVSDVKVSINLGFADNTAVRNSETVHSADKTLTLEALFGAAFMNELHSVEAPLSVKSGSAVETINNDVTRSQSLPLQCADNVFFSSTSNENQTNQRIHGGNLLAPNHAQEAKTCNIPGPSRRYGDTPIEGSKLSDVGFNDSAEEIQLPEEDSLITVGDSLDHTISDSPAFDYANKEQLIPGRRVGLLNGKLFNTILGDGERMSTHGLDGSSLLRGPYDMVDSDNLYSHLHGPPSQFPHQVNHTRPLFPQLDRLPFRNPQMFMGPDSIHHDPHHSFPTNAIPQHAFNTAGGPRFDLVAHHPMLQHMPIPPNFPPHHQIQGLPRSVPLSHPANHMPGYIPEMNNVHSFPMHNRQPSFAGLGMGMPGVGRGPNPEALERLIEMEMRANSKQIHPAAGGHVPGIYGPQFDMNFRYR